MQGVLFGVQVSLPIETHQRSHSRCHVAHDCAYRDSGAGSGGGGSGGDGEGEVESMPLGRGREGISDSLFVLYCRKRKQPCIGKKCLLQTSPG